MAGQGGHAVRRLRTWLNSASQRQATVFASSILVVFFALLLIEWALVDPGLLSLALPFGLMVVATLALMWGSSWIIERRRERDSKTAASQPELQGWRLAVVWVLGYAALAGALVVVGMLVAEAIRVF